MPKALRIGVLAAVIAVIAVIGFGSYVAITGQGESSADRTLPRLVVLPFENLGAADNEYFAAGITDEVTARLAGLNGLIVIARQSAMQYKGSDKTPQEIGGELDAQYLLEATVSWQRGADGSSRVRIRPQLIRASDAGHVWADVYDEDMTEVFAVQTAIANRVVDALGVALLAPEEQSLAARPTDNLEAYDLFLRANGVWSDLFTRRGGEIALPLLERAVELDPDFALAHASIGETHRQMYHYFFDRTEARLGRAKESIDRAIAIDPTLVEARLALANYYYSRFDYDRALAELEPIRQAHPNHSEILLMRASVLRRRGNVEESIADYEAGVRVNPRSASLALNLALSYMLVREYAAAARELDRAISLSPEVARQYKYKLQLSLQWRGDTAAARETMAQVERLGFLTAPDVVPAAMFVYWLGGRFDDAISLLDRLPRDFASDIQYWYLPKELLYAETLHRMGRTEAARAHFESASVALEALVRSDTTEARYARSLGIAYARLGRREEAIRMARLGVDLLPVEREALRGVYGVEDLAAVYTIVGEHGAAIDRLEYLLSIPSMMSVPLLRIDPRWDALRDQPRFQRMVEGSDDG